MNHMFTLRLKELRKEADKTQEEMAKAIGVRRATYGEYERGNILPPITKIKKIADYFSVSVDYLYGNTNFKTPEEQDEILPTDISKQLKCINELLKNQRLTLYYDNKPMSSALRDFIKNNIDNILSTSKIIP